MVQITRCQLRQFGRQGNHGRVRRLEKGIVIRQLQHLGMGRICQFITAITDVGTPQTRHAIQQFNPVAIAQKHTFGAGDHAGPFGRKIGVGGKRMHMVGGIQFLQFSRGHIVQKSHVRAPVEMENRSQMLTLKFSICLGVVDVWRCLFQTEQERKNEKARLMSKLASNCALCGSQSDLAAADVPPAEQTVTLCDTCRAGVEGEISATPHWRCLSDAIWSVDAATQVTAYRLLTRLKSEGWARDLLDIAYLEPENLTWAEAGLTESDEENDVIHRDTNGAVLAAGDTVTLIKDLNVKGAGFTAKRGTAVRNISLVPDNAGHIEGRVSGQQIVILTEFVKKS